MASLPRKRITVPLAPLVAGVLATVVALVFALLPGDLLGEIVLSSGVAALVPAAEPPLGATARAALILIGGGGIGLAAWFATFLLVGTRSIAIGGRAATVDNLPVLRRADAHPDAPARRPLFAAQDLGTPFLDIRAPVHVVADDVVEQAPVAATIPPFERALPADLDLPLSAYDPHALRSDTIAAEPSPASRPPVFDAGDRFETFELTPMVRAAPDAAAPEPAAPPRADFDPSASINALLDRLEKGVTRRMPAAPATRDESLQESLASLRRLAMTR